MGTAHPAKCAHCEFLGKAESAATCPAVAIRRLLDGTEAASDSYTPLCDQDLAGTGVLYRSIIWNPPELLLPCGDCHGRGEYVGLLEGEARGRCGGRKMVSV